VVGPPPEWSQDLEILVANANRNLPSKPGAREAADANTGALLRLGWMLGGNILLLIVGLTIFMGPPWTITFKDALFWAVVALVILVRYVDVTRFAGQTADGKPATRRDFVRYALGLVTSSAAIWTLAQSVQVA